jgi:hypothetical protein
MPTNYIYTNTLVHISSIRPEDVVELDGEHHTVCQRNIKKDQFVGYTIFGDTYRLGILPVMKVNVFHAKGVI